MSKPTFNTSSQGEFGERSLWRDSYRFDREQASGHAERLEMRARAASEVQTRDEYLQLFALRPGEHVLDVGCGSGAVTRAIAQRIAPGGKVTGLDASDAILEVARDLADASGVGDGIEFKQGDCRALSFSDSMFDAVISATTLCHVPDPGRALGEMVRVTRPGGRVGIFELDSDMCLFTHPDRALTRRIIEVYSDQMTVNGWLVRELPARLAELGIVNVKIRAFMPLETGGYYANRAERAAEMAATTGAISRDESTRWLEALHAEIDGKRFLGGQLHLFVWGKRGSA